MSAERRAPRTCTEVARGMAVVAWLALVACQKPATTTQTTDAGAPIATVPAASAPPVSPPSDAAVEAAAAPSAQAAEPVSGTVQLVAQSVDTVCMTGPGETHRGKVGVDVFVEVTNEGSKTPVKHFAFCPAKDGKKPQLQTWQNCSAFLSCKIDGDAVVCGKERIELDVTKGTTILRGSFGDRELAPHPMRVLPPKRTRRDAAVDC